MIRVGWFSTGRGEGSIGLLRFVQERILAGVLEARIEFVFSNRETGEAEGSDRFLQQVRDYGLPLVNLSSQKFRRAMGGKFSDHRREYDREVMERLQGFRVELGVLGGYMLITAEEMCNRYTLLNLHPALPDGPIGTWQEVIWRLIESRAGQTGAMVHIATEEVDHGPVVSYFTLPIKGGGFDELWPETVGRPVQELKEGAGEDLPLFRLIRQEGARREPHLLAATLSALSRGELRVRERRVLDSRGTPIEGLCLDREIAAALDSG